jgi:hypothetical protein
MVHLLADRLPVLYSQAQTTMFARFAKREPNLLSILLILLLFAVILSVVLWLGSVFAQGYFYTTPTEDLYWRGPAAAGVMVGFLLLWSLLNLSGGNAADDKKIPYPGILSFTNNIDMVTEPVGEIESKGRNTDPTMYKLDKTGRGTRYKKVNGDEYWSPERAEYIKFKHNGTDYTFVPEKNTEGGYRVFTDPDHGWVMTEQRIGIPSQTSSGRLFVYFLLNFFHLVLWVTCFWLLLNYTFNVALLFGALFWLGFSLMILPVLFDTVQAAVG